MSSVLLLSSDEMLVGAMTEFLRLDHVRVLAEAPATASRVDLVMADLDYLPEGWDLRRLRAGFRRTPCVVLSASPWAGPHTTSRLRNGYFLAKPTTAGELRSLVCSLLGGARVG
jgi:hypothetical protein